MANHIPGFCLSAYIFTCAYGCLGTATRAFRADAFCGGRPAPSSRAIAVPPTFSPSHAGQSPTECFILSACRPLWIARAAAQCHRPIFPFSNARWRRTSSPSATDRYRGKPYRRTNAVHSIIEHLEPNAAEQIGKRKPYHKGIDRGIQKGEPCLPCAIGQAVGTEKYSGQKIVKTDQPQIIPA